MRVRLLFDNGSEVEVPCTPEDFRPARLGGRLRLGEQYIASRPRISDFVFVVHCAYCGEPFTTRDPRSKYDCDSHRKLASLYKLPSVKQRLG